MDDPKAVALALRAQGLTYKDIGAELRCSRQRAHQLVQQAGGVTVVPDPPEVKQEAKAARARWERHRRDGQPIGGSGYGKRHREQVAQNFGRWEDRAADQPARSFVPLGVAAVRAAQFPGEQLSLREKYRRLCLQSHGRDVGLEAMVEQGSDD